MNLKEIIENNVTLSVMLLALGAFAAGWGAYAAVIKAGNNEVISVNELRELRGAQDKLKKLEERQPVDTHTKGKLKVVFVDALQRRYFEKDDPRYRDGNAAYLVHRVTNSDVGNVVDPTSAIIDHIAPQDNPQRYGLAAQRVKNEKPDIVVIHRSAFCAENERNKRECDARLAQFLSEMREGDTVFLVYSRWPDTNSDYAANLENVTTLVGRISVYEFKEGFPFDDGRQVDHFLHTLLTLVRARMCQKS